MVDTGATTTFIHEKLITNLTETKIISKTPYSFVLADGLAPFKVLGTIQLIIKFGNISTPIDAHIAQNLCTNIILEMDYINLYNLGIDVKTQAISINVQNHTLTMNIDQIHQSPSVSIPSCSSFSIFAHFPQTLCIHQLEPPDLLVCQPLLILIQMTSVLLSQISLLLNHSIPTKILIPIKFHLVIAFQHLIH